MQSNAPLFLVEMFIFFGVGYQTHARPVKKNHDVSREESWEYCHFFPNHYSDCEVHEHKQMVPGPYLSW